MTVRAPVMKADQRRRSATGKPQIPVEEDPTLRELANHDYQSATQLFGAGRLTNHLQDTPVHPAASLAGSVQDLRQTAGLTVGAILDRNESINPQLIPQPSDLSGERMAGRRKGVAFGSSRMAIPVEALTPIPMHPSELSPVVIATVLAGREFPFPENRLFRQGHDPF